MNRHKHSARKAAAGAANWVVQSKETSLTGPLLLWFGLVVMVVGAVVVCKLLVWCEGGTQRGQGQVDAACVVDWLGKIESYAVFEWELKGIIRLYNWGAEREQVISGPGKVVRGNDLMWAGKWKGMI